MQTPKNFGHGRYRFLGLFFTQVFTQAKPHLPPRRSGKPSRASPPRVTFAPPCYKLLT